MPAALNLTGRKFGTTRVLERTGRSDPWGYVLYHCRCKCGHEFKASTRDIRDGRAIHCERPARKKTHAADPGLAARQQAAQVRIQSFLCRHPAQAFEP